MSLNDFVANDGDNNGIVYNVHKINISLCGSLFTLFAVACNRYYSFYVVCTVHCNRIIQYKPTKYTFSKSVF